MPLEGPTRRCLCDQIVANAARVKEYESGSEYATRVALDKARAIKRDAELLEFSLWNRLGAIAPKARTG